MNAFPELPIIARCHSYAIRTKYQYQCEKCGYTIGRHSKSLDVASKCCGYCRGKLILLPTGSEKKASKGKENVSDNCETPKKLNPFAAFVKENYKLIRTPERTHADTMKKLGEDFAKSKITC